jgi:hypothetical protein
MGVSFYPDLSRTGTTFHFPAGAKPQSGQRDKRTGACR